jgi:predicted aldo/keto reductase-like oxidoreductase
MYAALPVGVEACAQCGECLDKCPAGLPIPDLLQEVGELF